MRSGKPLAAVSLAELGPHGSTNRRRSTAPSAFCGYAVGVKLPLRIALLALGAGAFALAVRSGFPLCPLAGSFGIPCPGCGLTRATLALLHGDVRSALQLHPLVLVLTPLAAAVSCVTAWSLLRLSAPQPPGQVAFLNGRFMSRIATLVLVLTLGIWLARFAGFFGGPVPVTSMRDWLAR